MYFSETGLNHSFGLLRVTVRYRDNMHLIGTEGKDLPRITSRYGKRGIEL